MSNYSNSNDAEDDDWRKPSPSSLKRYTTDSLVNYFSNNFEMTTESAATSARPLPNAWSCPASNPAKIVLCSNFEDEEEHSRSAPLLRLVRKIPKTENAFSNLLAPTITTPRITSQSYYSRDSPSMPALVVANYPISLSTGSASFSTSFLEHYPHLSRNHTDSYSHLKQYNSTDRTNTSYSKLYPDPYDGYNFGGGDLFKSNSTSNGKFSSGQQQSPWQSPYYYFEVTLKSGKFFIGFVSAQRFMSEEELSDWKLGYWRASSTASLLCKEDDRKVPAVAINNNNTQDQQHPFSVLENTFPGKCDSSIGLETQNGNLYINNEKKDFYYPVITSAAPGAVIGCGIQTDSPYSVFFTLNGDVLQSEQNRFPQLLLKNNAVAVFPSVGVIEGSNIVGNFGQDPFAAPFRFQPHAATFAPINPTTKSTPPSLNEEEDELERAKQLSLIDSATSAGLAIARGSSITKTEVSEIYDYSRQLQRCLHEHNNNTHNIRDAIDNLSALCRSGHDQIVAAIESQCGDDEDDFLSYLIQVNSELVNVLDEADKVLAVPVPSIPTTTTAMHHASQPPKIATTNNNNENIVHELAKKKDIFNLICLLRSVEDRVEAAEALLSLVKNGSEQASSNGNGMATVQNEIISSGGMHSLLTLFKSCTVAGNKEDMRLKKVAAMTVTCLVPSCKDGMDYDGATKMKLDFELKLLECFRFLIVELNDKEARKCSAVALSHRWLNVMHSNLINHTHDSTNARAGGNVICDINSPINNKMTTKPSGRFYYCSYLNDGGEHSFLVSGGRGRRQEKRRQILETQQVTEQAVALVVALADSSEVDERIALVMETMCDAEQLWPILVREGIIKVLVRWLSSSKKDVASNALKRLILPHPDASNALERLTLPHHDPYMAGWMHSQILSEGAIPAIVELSSSAQRNVRLAISEILCSLTVAPHTREAVVKAGGPSSLVELLKHAMQDILSDEWDVDVALSAGSANAMQDILNDAWDADVAFAAGSALLRLITGLPTQPSDWVHRGTNASDDEPNNFICKIVEKGVLDPLVKIASSSLLDKRTHCEEARSVAVQLLRLISDDIRSDFWAWEQLCHAGAAKALAGNILKEDIKYLPRDEKKPAFISSYSLDNTKISAAEISRRQQRAVQELVHGITGLANLLEPFPSEEVSVSNENADNRRRSADSLKQCLDITCKETAESGGVGFLLSIASLPLQSLDNSMSPVNDSARVDSNGLLLESYRALASLCNLLLSPSSEQMGLTGLTVEILPRLSKVLLLDSSDEMVGDIVGELQINSLRGLRSLAEYFPLKDLIIESCLPQLLQLRKSRTGATGVTQFANQVCLELQLGGPQSMDVVGSDLKSWADWFHLESSLLLQSMAKYEIMAALFQTWNQDLDVATTSVSEKKAQTSDGGTNHQDSSSKVDSFDKKLQEIFPQISEKHLLVPHGCLAKIVHQYSSVYEYTNGLVSNRNSGSRLSVNSSTTPFVNMKEWILLHKQTMECLKNYNLSHPEQLSKYCFPLARRVLDLLDFHFPSSVIQSEVLPLLCLQPSANFNFIGLDMPQRKYFSFRREGQVLQRMCEKILSRTDPVTFFWTLGFSKSSFGGEFTETLVQTLYRCRNIRSISFTDTQFNSDLRISENEDKTQSRPSLVSSLPPWVTYLTFDNIASNSSLPEIMEILTIGNRRAASKNAPIGNTEATFEALAIRNSDKMLRSVDLSTFIDHIHSGVFTTLRVLDLSGNRLGDQVCANLLATVMDPDSRCTLERLDLSGNEIGNGIKVCSALERHRKHQVNSSLPPVKQFKCHLTMLLLASNDLCMGDVPRMIISMLENDYLELLSLSLANNGITGNEEGIRNDFAFALANNTKLIELDLSQNKLNSSFFSRFLRSDNTPTGLGFVNVEGNVPPLDEYILRELQILMKRARKNRVFRLSEQLLDADRPSNNAPGKEAGSVSYSPTAPPKLRPVQSDSATLPQSERILGIETGRKLTHQRNSLSNDQVPDEGFNKITVLFSAPLVSRNGSDVIPVEGELDFEGERDLLWKSFREASVDIELAFDTATTDRLLAAKSRGCTCLHFSGHGHKDHLIFEDGKGEIHWLSANQLKNSISNGNDAGETPFKFVFVSACYSSWAGQIFVDAGVPHVVCCNQDVQIMDCAALAFTRQFYLALAYGRTVKDAFEIGRQAVAVSPGIPNSEQEMKKFVLLPADGNHDQRILNAAKVSQWPSNGATDSISLFVGKCDGLANIPEQPLPSLPLGFLGRERDIYNVLQGLLNKRCVSLIGIPGIGISSVASAVCHYITDRKSTLGRFEAIFYLQPLGTHGANKISCLINQLYKKLVDAKQVENMRKGADFDDIVNSIKNSLRKVKALLVFDGVDILDSSGDAPEFSLFLGGLFKDTKVKVLLTAQKPFGGISFAGEGAHPIHIGPLTMRNSVKLFLSLCPHLRNETERRSILKKLCPEADAKRLPNDQEMSENSKILLRQLGEGVPQRIFDIAFSMEKKVFDSLLMEFDRNR